MSVNGGSRWTLHLILEGGLPVSVDLATSATVIDLVRALKPGLSGGDLVVWEGQAALPPEARVRDAQLFQYTVVRIEESRPDRSLSQTPVLSSDDEFRVVHLDGRQLATAWPVRGRVGLRLCGSYWVTAVESEADLVLQVVLYGQSRALSVALQSTQYELSCGGRKVPGPTPVPGGGIFSVHRDDDRWDMQVLTRADHDSLRNAYGYVSFTARPRRARPATLEGREILLKGAPSEQKPELDVTEMLLTLLPTIASILLVSVAVGFRWYYLLLAPVVVVSTYYLRRHRLVKELSRFIKSRESWLGAANQAAGECLGLAQSQAAALHDIYPETTDLIRDAVARGGDLWCRSVSDPDFLTVSLGLGDFISENRVRASSLPENEESRHSWEHKFEQARRVPDTPIPFDLRRRHLALVGVDSSARAVSFHVLIQVLALHSPSTVSIVVLAPSSHDEHLGWLRLSPHVTSPSRWSGVRYLNGSSEAAAFLQANLNGDWRSSGESTLMVVDEAAAPPIDLLSEYSRHAEAVSILWLGGSWATIPSFVQTWLNALPYGMEVMPAGTLLRPVSTVPGTKLELFCRALAPLVDLPAAKTGALAVPDVVGLSAVLTLGDDLFRSSAVDGIDVEFLVDAQGAFTFSFSKHGPHLLVGGTTGSGKSEFVRALLCSAVAKYGPEELALILIDYKGGSSLGDFRNLPQTAGFVSNASEMNVDRLLKFLASEQRRRELLIAPFSDYIGYRKSGSGNRVLPRMLVVFDEFASFVNNAEREQMVVSLAQKGRSVGIHLVLATQSPGTAVTKNIRDNIDARFALRTADASASTAILDSPLASEIAASTKGRVLARLGDDKLRTFQSAYTKSRTLPTSSESPVTVLSSSGIPAEQTYALDTMRPDQKEDWEEVVSRVGSSLAPQSENGDGQPRLDPSLSDRDEADFAMPFRFDPWRVSCQDKLVVGISDRPTDQRQTPETCLLERASILISGLAGSGKTSLLQSFVWQFGGLVKSANLVVIDPTSTSTGGWDRVSTGSSRWLVCGDVGDSIDHLLDQVENILMSANESDRVLIVMDRLDQIATTLTESQVVRLAGIIANGPRRGVSFTCSRDPRVSLDARLSRAFLRSYEFDADLSWILREVEQGTYVRTPNPVLQSSGATEYTGNAVLGPVTAETAEYLLNKNASDMLALGLDETRHSVVSLESNVPLVVFGSTPEFRRKVILSFATRAASLGWTVAYLGPIKPPESVIDLVPTMMGVLSDELAGHDTLTVRFKKAIESVSADVLVVDSVDSLARTLRPRLVGEYRWSANVVHAELSSTSAFLGETISSNMVTPWATYRMPRFSHDVDFRGELLVGNAAYLYLEPRSQILMGAFHDEASGILAARPGKRYGTSRAVLSLQGERIELSHFLDDNYTN